jgi:hypothetical protein
MDAHCGASKESEKNVRSRLPSGAEPFWSSGFRGMGRLDPAEIALRLSVFRERTAGGHFDHGQTGEAAG